jgi:hypothetical protein
MAHLVSNKMDKTYVGNKNVRTSSKVPLTNITEIPGRDQICVDVALRTYEAKVKFQRGLKKDAGGG